jgi:hypothetical protein
VHLLESGRIVRFRITIDIERRHNEPDVEEQFEHRDTEAYIEATGGGDPRMHRMGFNPPVQDDHRGMQPARVQYHPAVRPPGSRIQPPRV